MRMEIWKVQGIYHKEAVKTVETEGRIYNECNSITRNSCIKRVNDYKSRGILYFLQVVENLKYGVEFLIREVSKGRISKILLILD